MMISAAPTMPTHDQLLKENAVLRKQVRELTEQLRQVNDRIELSMRSTELDARIRCAVEKDLGAVD